MNHSDQETGYIRIGTEFVMEIIKNEALSMLYLDFIALWHDLVCDQPTFSESHRNILLNENMQGLETLKGCIEHFTEVSVALSWNTGIIMAVSMDPDDPKRAKIEKFVVKDYTVFNSLQGAVRGGSDIEFDQWRG